MDIIEKIDSYLGEAVEVKIAKKGEKCEQCGKPADWVGVSFPNIKKKLDLCDKCLNKVRLKQYLTEEYIGIFTSCSEFRPVKFEIFENPTMREFAEVSSRGNAAVRGVIDKDLKKWWIWKGTVLHEDLPDEALEKMGRRAKFHLYIRKPRLGGDTYLYTTAMSGQLSTKQGLKFKDMVLRIAPQLAKARFFVDDLELEEELSESEKWYLTTEILVRELPNGKFNIFTTRIGTQERKGHWSRSKKMNQSKKQVEDWIKKVKKDSEEVKVEREKFEL